MATANGTLHEKKRVHCQLTKLQTTGWPVVDSQSEFSIRLEEDPLRRTGKQSEMGIAANCLSYSKPCTPVHRKVYLITVETYLRFIRWKRM